MHRIQWTGLASVAVSLAVLSSSVQAGDWPQWRGPARDGVAAPISAPKAWPEKLQKVWSLEVGGGHSSPLVVEDRIYLHSRQGDDEVIASYDLKSGKVLWRDSYPRPYTVAPEAAEHGKGPFSTPTYDDGKLYAFGMHETLSAYDAKTGKLLWRNDYSKEFAQPFPNYGAALSPLLADGLCIVHVGGPGKGSLLALDAATGKVKWRLDGEGPSYASPVVAEFSGVKQIVTQTQFTLVGVSLATGELLWKMPYKVPYENNIITAAVHGDTFIVSGVDLDVMAVRPVKKDGKWTTETAWSTRQGSLYMSSPVLAGGLLYGYTIFRRGQVYCLDPKTGKILWTSPGNEGENGNLVAAGDYLFVLKDSADLDVLRRNAASYQKVASYSVADSPTWAYPVVMDGKVLVKDAKNLTLWSWAA